MGEGILQPPPGRNAALGGDGADLEQGRGIRGAEGSAPSSPSLLLLLLLPVPSPSARFPSPGAAHRSDSLSGTLGATAAGI